MIQKCILKCIISYCKLPQNFDFGESGLALALGLFGLKSFHMSFSFSFDGRMELIARLLFYLVIKMKVLRFYEKPYQTWQAAVQTLKEKSKCSNKNTQKESKKKKSKKKISIRNQKEKAEEMRRS